MVVEWLVGIEVDVEVGIGVVVDIEAAIGIVVGVDIVVVAYIVAVVEVGIVVEELDGIDCRCLLVGYIEEVVDIVVEGLLVVVAVEFHHRWL